MGVWIGARVVLTCWCQAHGAWERNSHGSQEFWATLLTLQVLISFGHRCGRAVFVSDSLLLLALLLLVVVVVNRTSTSERRVSKAMKER